MAAKKKVTEIQVDDTWVDVTPERKGPPMCEGTREELERTGTAVDPFTGATLTKEDL